MTNLERVLQEMLAEARAIEVPKALPIKRSETEYWSNVVDRAIAVEGRSVRLTCIARIRMAMEDDGL